jgi:GTP pyrophosphokinase
VKGLESRVSLDLGRELLDRELRRGKKSKPSEAAMQRTAKALNLMNFEQVLEGLGRGELGPTAILKELFPGEEPLPPKPPTAFEKLVNKVRGGEKGVRIQGVDNMMIRYSQCCQPVPGDAVIGYITRGRGISIHRTDCPNVLNLAEHPERRIEIEWEAESQDRFFVRVVVEGDDRRGLLSDIANAITGTGTNIGSAEIKTHDGGMTGSFVVEVQDLPHLKKVMRAIRNVNGVSSAERREHFAGVEDS